MRMRRLSPGLALGAYVIFSSCGGAVVSDHEAAGDGSAGAAGSELEGGNADAHPPGGRPSALASGGASTASGQATPSPALAGQAAGTENVALAGQIAGTGNAALAGGVAGTEHAPPGDCVAHSFGQSDYWFCKNAVDWFTAVEACDSVGFTLASIEDQQENQFIVDTALAEGMRAQGGLYETGWVGGNDLGSEGAWRWESGATWGYSNWANGEPNNVGDEDCLVLWHTAVWNDLGCTRQQPYVCESP